MGPADDDKARADLRARFASATAEPTPVNTVKRVQKNLSLDERDVERLLALARRDHLSQARLIAKALDAYEALHGKIGPGKVGS